jgi:hypothetical protein
LVAAQERSELGEITVANIEGASIMVWFDLLSGVTDLGIGVSLYTVILDRARIARPTMKDEDRGWRASAPRRSAKLNSRSAKPDMAQPGQGEDGEGHPTLDGPLAKQQVTPPRD